LRPSVAQAIYNLPLHSSQRRQASGKNVRGDSVDRILKNSRSFLAGEVFKPSRFGAHALRKTGSRPSLRKQSSFNDKRKPVSPRGAHGLERWYADWDSNPGPKPFLPLINNHLKNSLHRQTSSNTLTVV
jgi:hypothetical protein